MAEVEELILSLKAENDQFRAEMKASQADLAKATSAMSKAVNDFSEKSEHGFTLSKLAFGSFIGNLASSATMKAFDILRSAFNMVITEGIKGAEEGQAATARLANAFALAGENAADAVPEIQKLAEELGNATAFEDDAILSTSALIESMARLDSEGLARATEAAVNFAAATGKDLPEVAAAVAKAADGQVAALSRLGIKLQDTGDKTKNAEMAMAALEARFGGSAQRTVETFAGSLTRAQNAFGNTTEEFGNLIVQNPVVIAGLNALSVEFQKLTKFIGDNKPALMGLTSDIATGAVSAFAYFASVINVTHKAFTAFSSAVIVGGQLVVDSFQGVAAAASGNFNGAIKAFQETGVAWNHLKDGLKAPGLMDSVIDAAANVKGGMELAFGRAPVDGMNAALGVTKSQFAAINAELTPAQEGIKKFVEGLAAKGADPTAGSKEREDALKSEVENKLISEEEYLIKRQDLLNQQNAVEWQALSDANKEKIGTEEERALAEEQLRKDQHNKIIAEQSARTAFEKEQAKVRQENLKSSLGTISSLQSASSKELQGIGKAAAIATATMDGIVAVQKAMAAAPPPFGFALAALVGTATAANIAKIGGVNLATGIDAVPGSGNRDTVPAMLTPGERVVPKQTNKDLSNFLDGQNAEPKTVVNNVFNISGLIPSDGEAVIRVINDAIARGSLKVLPA